MVQLSDALQYAWAQIPSRHVIVPSINPTKTWEGLLVGSASVTLIGGVLWWATPFQGSNWWMAAAMSLVISVMGFAGGLTLSAIKRDRGVRDYGTLVEGHGGLLGPHRFPLLLRPRLLPLHALLAEDAGHQAAVGSEVLLPLAKPPAATGSIVGGRATCEVVASEVAACLGRRPAGGPPTLRGERLRRRGRR